MKSMNYRDQKTKIETYQDKINQSKEIERHTVEFLKQGGEVKKINRHEMTGYFDKRFQIIKEEDL